MDFNLLIEKKYPVISALVITGVFIYLYNVKFGCYPVVIELAKEFIGLSGTLLGFLITIITIINTVSTARMKAVQVSGNYHRLMTYLKVSIFSNLILIGVSIVILIQGKYLNIDKYEYVNKTTEIIIYVFAFASTFCFASTFRFISIFMNLMVEKKSK